jgi:hypothetical protein
MQKRREQRRPRRIPVRFWRRGETTPHQGFTTNISVTGVFISTRETLPKGTRLRIEFADPHHGFVVEGVVARAARSDAALQQVMPAGVGVRFLEVGELVSELLPVGSQRSEPAPARPDQETAPQRQRVRLDAYTVRFPSDGSFRQSYERDVVQGGLFVATRFPAPMGRKVMLEIHPPGGEPFRLEAEVVQSVPPTPSEDGSINLLAGMGVQFLDPDGARDAFVGRLR